MEVKVLCVDDEKAILNILFRLLSKNGFNPRIVNNPEEAKEIFISFQPDIVLLDVMMPGISGNELLDFFHAHRPFVKVVMITAHPSEANIVHALQSGAFDFIAKPFKIEYLLNCLARAKEKIIAEEEHYKLQSELKQSNDSLNQLIKFKSDFLIRLIHDLKIPALTAAHVLERLAAMPAGELPDIVTRSMQRASKSTDLFLKILSNLMEMSLIETGKLQLEMNSLEIAPLLQSVASALQPRAQQLGLALTLLVPSEPLIFRGDKNRFSIILENLLTNAIHFTAAGGKVEIKTAAQLLEGVKMISVVITDTGIGIAKEEIPKIFEKHYRIKKTSPHGIQGVGLGLSIVRELLKIHNGKIFVSSTPGSGSKFTLLVPACDK
jgi:two-component system, sensor histidine kinase and response regulator